MMLGGQDRLSFSSGKLGGEIKELKKVAIPIQSPAGPVALDWDLQNDILGKITPPVVANGTAYLAATHQQRLYGLDSSTGAVKWEFPVAARIDSPPTIHNGLCLFGCRDGWVYALRASDGALVWKFLAAPSPRQIVSSGQLENASPVFGSVFVHKGKLFAAAGRHNQADGGIEIWKLNPASGSPDGSAVIDGSGNSGPDERGFATRDGQGRIADVITTTAGGKYLILNAFVINPDSMSWTLAERAEDGGPIKDIDLSDPSILAFTYNNAAGTMDRRSDSIGSKGGGGFYYGTRDRKGICTAARIVAGGGDKLFGVKTGGDLYRHTLDADRMPLPTGDKKRGELIGKSGARDGSIMAMAATEDALFVAAGPALAIHNHDGKPIQKIELSSPTVTYGIALAEDKVFLSLDDGTFAIYGK